MKESAHESHGQATQCFIFHLDSHLPAGFLILQQDLGPVAQHQGHF